MNGLVQVLSYVDVLRGKAKVGRRVAVIGAGGIGFDVSEYLLGEEALETPPEKRLEDVQSFLKVLHDRELRDHALLARLFLT